MIWTVRQDPASMGANQQGGADQRWRRTRRKAVEQRCSAFPRELGLEPNFFPFPEGSETLWLQGGFKLIAKGSELKASTPKLVATTAFMLASKP
jgi:hypothetical protein